MAQNNACALREGCKETCAEAIRTQVLSVMLRNSIFTLLWQFCFLYDALGQADVGSLCITVGLFVRML